MRSHFQRMHCIELSRSADTVERLQEARVDGICQICELPDRDGDEAGSSRIRCGHRHKSGVDLADIVDEVWSCSDIASVESDPFGTTGIKVELPVAAARRERRVSGLHVAHRLPVGPSAPAPGEVEQHEPLAEWRGNGRARIRRMGTLTSRINPAWRRSSGGRSPIDFSVLLVLFASLSSPSGIGSVGVFGLRRGRSRRQCPGWSR